MSRYTVHPIADEHCAAANTDELVLSTDNLTEAQAAASQAAYPYGAAIVDHSTGALDVGFGFGVPCPGEQGLDA